MPAKLRITRATGRWLPARPLMAQSAIHHQVTAIHSIAIHAGVFIVLGGIQIVATALIVFCAIRYKDALCPVHLPRQALRASDRYTYSSGGT